MKDKNGKEIKIGDLIIHDSIWFCTVVKIVDDDENYPALQVSLTDFDNILLQFTVDDVAKNVEVVTEQEAIIFLLKRGPNVPPF